MLYVDQANCVSCAAAEMLILWLMSDKMNTDYWQSLYCVISCTDLKWVIIEKVRGNRKAVFLTLLLHSTQLPRCIRVFSNISVFPVHCKTHSWSYQIYPLWRLFSGGKNTSLGPQQREKQKMLKFKNGTLCICVAGSVHGGPRDIYFIICPSLCEHNRVYPRAAQNVWPCAD